jgi:flavodoxin
MKVKIIFSTEVGTTKSVAEQIAKTLTDLQHQVDLYQVGKQPNPPDFTGYDAVLFGSPTYNEGQVETKMADFLSSFAANLSSLKTAVFSLGDSNYVHFCGSAAILETWIAQHGGVLAVPTLKIDGYPKNEEVAAWARQLVG